MASLTAKDRFAISDLVARFCFASDFGDYDALASIFTENPITEVLGAGTFEGLEWQVQHARDSERWTNGQNRHVVTNLWMEPEGDGAVAHYFVINFVSGTKPGEPRLVTTGRFDDHLVRTPAGWRIARRRFVPDQPFEMPALGADVTPEPSVLDLLNQVLETGVPDGFIARLAPGAVLWHNSDKREIDAVAGLQGVKALHALVSDVRVEVVQQEQLTGGVMQRVVLRGTVKATGRPLAAHNCVVVHLADGRITRMDEYVDPTFEAQLGL